MPICRPALLVRQECGSVRVSVANEAFRITQRTQATTVGSTYLKRSAELVASDWDTPLHTRGADGLPSVYQSVGAAGTSARTSLGVSLS